MGRYHVELPGQLSLAQQSKAVEGEEALAARFIGLRLWVNATNAVTNLAEFEELDTAPDPPLAPPRFVKSVTAGMKTVWAGPMIVLGSAEQQVFLVRG